MKYKMIQATGENEEGFHLLAEAIPQLVWITDANGKVLYGNQKLYSYTQATFEELQSGDWIQRYIHPEDQHRMRKIRQESLKTGELYEIEYRLKNGEAGEYRWFLVRGLPLKNAHGQILRWFGTSTDIDESKRIEEALRISEQRFRKLFESNIIGVSVFDRHGNIIEANDAILDITGYTRKDILSGSLHGDQLIPVEYPYNTSDFQKALMETESMTAEEADIVRKDGSRTTVLMGATVLDRQQGTGITYMLDVSDRKELERRKDVFISIASHELKSPLANIKLLSQQLLRKLRKGKLESPETYISQIETQIDGMTNLVNDFLDIAKMQSGGLEYVEEAFDLDELINEVVATVQRVTDSHTLTIHGETKKQIVGDRTRLGQVFTNLLSNAVKYSPLADQVVITRSASSSEVTIGIQDYGPGIAKEHQRRIFERFYRIHSKKETGVSGLGIGLSISHDIAKHHGGDISIESEEGKGSTFTVLLPLPENI